MPSNNYAYLDIDYIFIMTYSLPYFKCAINQRNKWKTSYHIKNISCLYLTSTKLYAKISKSSWYQGYRINYFESIYLNRCILLISFWVSFSADMRTFMDLFVATYQFFPTNNCNHSCMPWYQNMLQWLSYPTKILRIWKERKLKSQSHDAPTDILRNGGM